MSDQVGLPARITDTTCAYTFDPSKEVEARIRTTWECPHEAYGGSDHCLFHMGADERAAHDVTNEDVADAIVENLRSADPRMNEYVGADIPELQLSYQELEGDTNHVVNLQHADVDAIDLTHGQLHQGLNLREASVGTLKLDDAVVTGSIEAADADIDELSAYEAVFHEDVDLTGVDFYGPVDCDDATFHDDISLSAATFHDRVQFRNVSAEGNSHVLDDNTDFSEARFTDEASFRQTAFEYVTFEASTFEALADFEHVAMDGDGRFQDVTFEGLADFDEARFLEDVSFEGAAFEAGAQFDGAVFSGGSRTTEDDASFQAATFADDATFEQTRFRYANFTDATFERRLELCDATVEDSLDATGVEVRAGTTFEGTTFDGPVDLGGATFHDEISCVETEYRGDAAFEETTFEATARFDETRFREDASFRAARFRAPALFRGAVFEGEAKHLEENATFRESVFEAEGDFAAASFTNASFWDATFHAECNFEGAEFLNSARFRVHPGDDDTYVDLTDATVGGGEVVQAGGDVVPYDLTRATVGDIRIDGEGGEYELLEQFRFCLTEFDAFDFTDHHSALERNDWVIHTFVGNAATESFAVDMTPEVIEETYRKAQDSAGDVGDTPAMREFEFKRYYFNRKKNVDLILHDYSLDAVTKLKKGASVVLNNFMQYSCGYGNRLPRIAALTFLLPAVFGVLYSLPMAPFQTTADPLSVFDGIYYSYISFSTVGYGDINPVGWAARSLAATQGMLNGLFFTLLTFTLFKRVLGGS